VLSDPLLVFGFVYVLGFLYFYLIVYPVVVVILCYFMFDLMTLPVRLNSVNGRWMRMSMEGWWYDSDGKSKYLEKNLS
jgi:hypothetical protein